MSGLYFICGLLGLSVATPFLLFELIKNIRELEKMKENSNEEISAIIDIHFEELKKLDMFYKEK